MTTQMAQQCLDDFGTLEARMNEVSFWLTGWRGGATMGPVRRRLRRSGEGLEVVAFRRGAGNGATQAWIASGTGSSR